MGVEIVQRAAAARSGEAGVGGDRQGGARQGPGRHRAGKVHGGPGAGGGGRPPRLHDFRRRRAAVGRRPELLLEEGRRQSHRRADRRREGEHLLGSGPPARADRGVRRLGPAGHAGTPGSRRACSRISFYSRFWAEKMGKKPTGGPNNIIMEGGTRLDERSDRRRRARRAGHALLVHPSAGSADDPLYRSDARRAVPDREGQGHARGEEHALEREPDRRVQQPRRDDAGRARGQRRGHRRRRVLDRLSGGARFASSRSRARPTRFNRGAKPLGSDYDFLACSSAVRASSAYIDSGNSSLTRVKARHRFFLASGLQARVSELHQHAVHRHLRVGVAAQFACRSLIALSYFFCATCASARPRRAVRP